MFKTFKFSFYALIIALTSFAFVSCSDDDDEPAPIALSDQVSGTYIGNGKLMYLDILEDKTFPGMKIEVTRSSESIVIVDIKEANNSPFFASSEGDAYEVLKSKNGYILRDPNDPVVEISINAQGVMKYKNPHISVGGEGGYSLIFEGEKE